MYGVSPASWRNNLRRFSSFTFWRRIRTLRCYMGLLDKALRLKLETMIKKGVPPVTAGMVYGLRQTITLKWIRLGMQEEAPQKPECPKRKLELSKYWFVTEEEWYRHELECRKLAECICQAEGLFVGKLINTLWNNSVGKKADLATSRFMFNKYQHAHGMAEPAKHVKDDDSEGDDKDGDDVVTITLPDNGRLMVKA